MKKVSPRAKIIVSLVSLLLYLSALLLTPIAPYQIRLSWQNASVTVLFRYTQRLPSTVIGMSFLEGSSTTGTVQFISRDAQTTSTGRYISQDGGWYLSEATTELVEITLLLTCYIPVLARVFEPHPDQADKFSQYVLNHSGEYIESATGSRLQVDREIDAFRAEIGKPSLFACRPFLTFVLLFTIGEVVFLLRIWRKKEFSLLLMPCKLLGLLVYFCLPFYFYSLQADILALAFALSPLFVQYRAVRWYKRENQPQQD